MQTSVIRTEVKTVILPKVGEPWGYDKSSNVYFRISDEEGQKIITNADCNLVFFSVNLSDGSIYSTSRLTQDIILLKPKNGIAEFEPLEN